MNKLNALHIYCTRGTRQMLEELAKFERRSLSAEVQALIERAHAEKFVDVHDAVKSAFERLK